MNGFKHAELTYVRAGKREVTPVDGFGRHGVEEVVEVGFEFAALIVREPFEHQRGRLYLVVLVVVLIQSTVQVSSEELVAHREEGLGVVQRKVCEESVLY